MQYVRFSLRDLKVQWVRAHSWNLLFFSEETNSDHEMKVIQTLLFKEFTEEDKM